MFNKLWLILVVYLVFSQISIAAQRTLNMNDVAWPPYFFIDNQTKKFNLGFGKELLNYCLAKSDYKVKYIRLPIDGTYQYMKQGKLDLTVYSYKKEREQALIYGKEPLFRSEYGFLVPANSKIQVNTLDDVLPYQIGHLAGLTYSPNYMKIINDKMKLKQVTVGHTLESMFLQLLAPNPRFDIMADSKRTFHWYAKSAGISDKVKVLDYNLITKDYFITVAKRANNIDNPTKLLNETDNCLKQMKKDGSYEAILAKYEQH